MRYSFLLFLAGCLLSWPAKSAEDPKIFVNPPSSQVSKAFKLKVSLPGQSCSKVKKFLVPLPAAWVRVKEEQESGEKGCLYSSIVYSKAPGKFTLAGVKALTDSGEIALREVEVEITEPKSEAAPSPSLPGPEDELARHKAEFREMLARYLSENQTAAARSGFTIESCRPRTQKLVQLTAVPFV